MPRPESDLYQSNLSQERLTDEEKSKLNSMLICQLCQGIVCKPLKCTACDFYFCGECIERKAKDLGGKCICGKECQKAKPDRLLLGLLSKYDALIFIR